MSPAGDKKREELMLKDNATAFTERDIMLHRKRYYVT